MSEKMIELTLMLMREEWYKQQKVSEQTQQLILSLSQLTRLTQKDKQ